MSYTKAELQHAINMLLEGQDLPLHARLRVMDVQAQLLLVEQMERIAAALETRPKQQASSDINYAGDAERAEYERFMKDDPGD